jgi:hypothetical protein
LLLELGGDAFAETAAAAGDDGDFAVEFALGHSGAGSRGDVLVKWMGYRWVWKCDRFEQS